MLKSYIHITFLIVFSVQFIFGTFTDVKEYANLFEHYEFHESQFGDNVYSFLEKHYGKNKASHTKEHQKKHTIPFDNHAAEHHINHFIPNFLLKHSENVLNLVFYQTKEGIIYKPNCQHWLLSNKLLQPPKSLI